MMDPFTQRMLERARARREKLDSKLVGSGQEVPKRAPLVENKFIMPESKRIDNKLSPIKAASPTNKKSNSPSKNVVSLDKAVVRSHQDVAKITTETYDSSPYKEIIKRVSSGRNEERTSVEINIKHGENIHVEVQVEEREVPMSVYLEEKKRKEEEMKTYPMVEAISRRNNTLTDKENRNHDGDNCKPGLRQIAKSKLQRLGVLYSDEPQLSSPIHRTEENFTSATPPMEALKEVARAPRDEQPVKRKFGRLAALANEINNWEDDLTHHNYTPQTELEAAKPTKSKPILPMLDESTCDISIHSYQDVAVVAAAVASTTPSKVDSSTFTKTPQSVQKLDKNIVDDLEAQGYRRTSTSQSRLVYDFSTKTHDPARQDPKGTAPTTRNTSANKMASMVVSGTASVVKKPSIKKYRAPTPPKKIVASNGPDNCETDKENNSVECEENDNLIVVPATDSGCIQTNNDRPINDGHSDDEPIKDNNCESINGDEPISDEGCVQENIERPIKTSTQGSPVSNTRSPLLKKYAPNLNNQNGERNSVLSKAAIFESNINNGSPKARDPAEMSIRERKALFERNKGSAIIPKAPFGMAPSAKALHPEKETQQKGSRPIANTIMPSAATSVSKSNSKEELNSGSTGSDNSSVTSLGGGIKSKLAALFSKEQTISEATIADKFKKEREKELLMLQNRFHFKNRKTDKDGNEEDQIENDISEVAPLMGSSLSLSQTPAIKKPEVIANVPKVSFQETLKTRSETALHDREDFAKSEMEKVVGQQPVKRRNSQDSPIVMSVLEDVKRIRVVPGGKGRDGNSSSNTANGDATSRIYPHLSDIETVTSSAAEEDSDCGNSSADSSLSSQYSQRNANTSDNWGDTSFGREVMEVVKKNGGMTNCSPAEKPTGRQKRTSDHNQSAHSGSSICSELDDGLNEALEFDDSDDGEQRGPTPAKINKNYNSPAQPSNSFSFKPGSAVKDDRFKSPLKVNDTGNDAASEKRGGKNEPLVHTVSFYRRMQNASSHVNSPHRKVRTGSPPPQQSQLEEQETAAQTAITVQHRISQLTDEINKQHTVISQASQALNLCASTVEFSGSTEQAEGERLLLLATHRRQACVHEIQRLRVEGPGAAAQPGKATLLLDRFVLPLRRDYIRQLNADDAQGHYVVCLVKCRDRVVATSMARSQPTSPTVTFPDLIRMENLTTDFKVTVEVYLLQASKESLPHEIKYHINTKKTSSKLLTPKSKVCELRTPRVQSPAGPTAVRTPQFQPHGYCIFALPQIQRTSFTLNKVPAGSPLEGSVSLRVRVRMSVSPPPPYEGFLTEFEDVSGLGAWHRRWYRLQGSRLSYWKYPDDANKKPPIGDIDLEEAVSDTVAPAPRDLCARMHTLLLETRVPVGASPLYCESLVWAIREDGTRARQHLLAADTAHDRDAWARALNAALEYVRCDRGGKRDDE